MGDMTTAMAVDVATVADVLAALPPLLLDAAVVALFVPLASPAEALLLSTVDAMRVLRKLTLPLPLIKYKSRIQQHTTYACTLRDGHDGKVY